MNISLLFLQTVHRSTAAPVTNYPKHKPTAQKTHRHHLFLFKCPAAEDDNAAGKVYFEVPKKMRVLYDREEEKDIINTWT